MNRATMRGAGRGDPFSRRGSQFQKLSFNNLLASSPAEEGSSPDCVVSSVPRSVGTTRRGWSLTRALEYFDAVAVINTGTANRLFTGSGASGPFIWPWSMQARRVALFDPGRRSRVGAAGKSRIDRQREIERRSILLVEQRAVSRRRPR